MLAAGHVTQVRADMTTEPGFVGLHTRFWIVDLSTGAQLAGCIIYGGHTGNTHCSDSTPGAFTNGDYLAVQTQWNGAAPGAVQVEFTTGP
jgi:hypothetical protein